jgi:hypothetical protein
MDECLVLETPGGALYAYRDSPDAEGAHPAFDGPHWVFLRASEVGQPAFLNVTIGTLTRPRLVPPLLSWPRGQLCFKDPSWADDKARVLSGDQLQELVLWIIRGERQGERAPQDVASGPRERLSPLAS